MSTMPCTGRIAGMLHFLDEVQVCSHRRRWQRPALMQVWLLTSPGSLHLSSFSPNAEPPHSTLMHAHNFTAALTSACRAAHGRLPGRLPFRHRPEPSLISQLSRGPALRIAIPGACTPLVLPVHKDVQFGRGVLAICGVVSPLIKHELHILVVHNVDIGVRLRGQLEA